MTSVNEPALNFDDLLVAVQESKRGRWFLDELNARIRRSETETVLKAIGKLELVMASTPAGADSALVAKARAAIAQARSDIARLDGAPSGLSSEARMFAHLAELARTAFTAEAQAPVVVTAGVGRALKLVDDLEADFAAASPVAKPTDYFSPDSGVFEAPVKSPVKAETKIEAKAEPAPVVPPGPPRGAKVVIRHSGSVMPAPAEDAAPAPALAAKPDTSPIPAPPALAVEAAPAPVETKPSRVIIIRRKPEELMAVPLPEEGMTAA
ncbi:MAG: hypothetical protein U1E15_03540 [Hyphomicrobiales bacterium]